MSDIKSQVVEEIKMDIIGSLEELMM